MKRRTILIIGFIIASTIPAFASYETAMDLYKEGKYEESLAQLAEILDIKNDAVPESPNYKIRFLAAHNHWKLKHYNDALTHLKKCMEIKPDSVDPLIDSSLILLEANRIREATSFAYRVLKLDKNNAMGYYLLGMVKMNYKNYWGAKELFEKALAFDPELYECWNGLGKALMQLRKYSDANTAFSTALAMFPQSAALLNNVGVSYFYLGKQEKALEYIEKALELDEENQEIIKNKEIIAAKTSTNK